MRIDDRELDRRLAALPRVTDAPEALWPGIERRLGARGYRIRTGAVAAALLAALAGWLWFQPGLTPHVADPAAVAFAAEADRMGVGAPEVTWIALDEDWHQAWRDNEAAILELERALEQHPGNALLLDFLAQARLRQSRLINQAMAGGAVEFEWRT